MKKKLFILAVALFMLMPFVKVNAAPPILMGGNFGVGNKCEWSLDTNGAFTIEPVDTACELEFGSKIIWSNYSDRIESFKIKSGVKAPANMDQYFWKLTNVEEIDVNELDVSSTTSMNQVFTDVGSNATNPIAELDLSKWNTSKVTEMDSMFLYSNIKSLKLGKGFDTSNVEYFGAMFAVSRFEELILNFDTSKLNSFTVMSMFQDATHLKKLDISSFDMTKARSYDGMFMNVGKDAKEGTEIILNSTFGGLAPSEFADYEFPYDFYTINGGDAFNLQSLNNRIAQTTGKASLIPVLPFQIHDGSSLSHNKYNHRTGTKIDTSNIKNITPKDGFKLVKWTDTPDPAPATIEIPAGGQSTNTYADFYNTKNVLNLGITLYAQWEREYKILKGANQTYIIGSNKDVVIKTDGDLSDLGKVQFDGKDLDINDYDVARGSTILTLKSSFLNKLTLGVHTVTLLYSGGTPSTTGSVSTNLTIAKENNNNNNSNNKQNKNQKGNQKYGNIANPQTGDNIVFYIMTMLLSLFGIAGASVYVNRKKLFNR